MRVLVPEEPVCFISTHLDDVGLSCSHYLAAHPGITVITVMTGAPEVHRKGDWNSWTTGKSYAPDAMRVRKDEDAAAMRKLRAEPVWLELWGSSYLDGQSPDEDGVAGALRATLMSRSVRSIVGPVGIRHVDHVAVSNACASVARVLDCELYYYLDMPYAQKYPAEVEDRLSELSGKGFDMQALEPVKPKRRIKKRVFKLYHSQYSTNDYENVNEVMSTPERYWHVLIK